jgi:2-polyprenyl-3-methyl-5-hydroxy-6-metoxy-1,4-benzoquinol methylase
MEQLMKCLLCGSKQTDIYWKDENRMYHQCQDCELVFVPSEYWLDPEEEKARYDLHENDPQDVGYRRFLGHLFHPLNERLEPGSHGLDFGSGPGPTLSVMLEEAGHHVDLYDPFYADHPEVFDRSYDFITATEVIEHLYDPWPELTRLWSMLRPGGYLAIMTQLVIDRKAFSTWHYKDDDTHVAFYSDATFRWIAAQLDAQLTLLPRNVILLRKA